MEDTNETCPICYEEIKKYGFCVTNCSHVFCMDCMVESMKQKRSCPLCRENMDPEVTDTNETADYKLGFQVGSEFGYEEGFEEGKESANKVSEKRIKRLVDYCILTENKCNMVKKELELTLLQFNTSIKLKNSFQFKPKKIRRTKSLD